jgi:hypothetical protein
MGLGFSCVHHLLLIVLSKNVQFLSSGKERKGQKGEGVTWKKKKGSVKDYRKNGNSLEATLIFVG